jgi:hypothetical protein
VRASILLAALVLLFSVSSSTQEVEHAPTVAQCQADQALWLSKLETRDGTSDILVQTLHKWQHEMSACEAVDSLNKSKYFNAETKIEAEIEGRELSFIYRHNPYQQFLDEDAAGKR